jgi:hypothetical protein
LLFQSVQFRSNPRDHFLESFARKHRAVIVKLNADAIAVRHGMHEKRGPAFDTFDGSESENHGHDVTLEEQPARTAARRVGVRSS